MEIVQEYNAVVTPLDGHKDAVVIVLACSREVDGERVAIVDAQKDAAMDAAKATLQCLGADVAACSTAFLVPQVVLGEDETLALDVAATLRKRVKES